MAGWLLSDGTYIQTIGEDIPPTDDAVEVSIRPDPYYDYVDGAWTINTEREYAYLADDVRAKRAEKLQEVDQIAGNALRWAELTAEQQAAWSQYRTDLLNITDQAGFPHNVTWPTKP
jgi:hypothetical protein